MIEDRVAVGNYEAILLDVDGTLLTEAGEIHPRTFDALQRIHAAGVRVMIATGRSELAARPILDLLGFDTPALVYNGAGLYCPLQDRLVEERLLSDRTVERALDHVRSRDLLPMVQVAGAKFCPPPRDELERQAVTFLEGMSIVSSEAELPREFVIRITVFSREHIDSAALARELETAVDQPLHMTHFPLSALPLHRESPLLVADLQPPCRGKAEALRYLEERLGIPSERVVAVGDASNDVNMVAEAGLGVAMANSMPSLLAVADRVIGHNDGDTIAQLVEELFP